MGRDLGLVDDGHWAVFRARHDALAELMTQLEQRRVTPDAAARAAFADLGEAVPTRAVSLADLLRRPSMSLERLRAFWPEATGYAPEVCEEAETIIRYSGYLARQEELVERAARQESLPLPEDLDYGVVAGLSREIVEKLTRVRPRTMGQASRISGVTPAALTCIEIHLRKLERSQG